jgi:hypothetical protein
MSARIAILDSNVPTIDLVPFLRTAVDELEMQVRRFVYRAFTVQLC